MKKRLLCMMLCLIMLMSAALVSCSDKSEEDEESVVSAVEGAQTLTMWVVSENKVSAKTEKEIEEAFSKITKSKYKVNVDIKFFDDEEKYYEVLADTIDESVKEEEKAEAARKALRAYLKKAKNKAKDEGFEYDEKKATDEFYEKYPKYEKYRVVEDDENVTAKEEETVTNEYGIPMLKYPDAEEYQVDIIYISGFDKYNEFIEKDWLAPLDDQLAGTSKKLNDYIPATLMNGAMVDGVTYAIPNNVAIGEYTYMMIDKELMEGQYCDYSKISNILDDDMAYFLRSIKKDFPDVVPIDATFEECMDLYAWYWNIGYEAYDSGDVDEKGNPVIGYDYSVSTDNKFNLFGTLYGDPMNVNRGSIELGFNSLFYSGETDSEYVATYKKLKEYSYNGYFGEAAEGQTAAISFVKGDYSIKKELFDDKGTYGVYKDSKTGKEYYGIVVKYPEADTNDLYGNMFGVCSFSNSVSASMKVITGLNTVPELRNILQYGIEGKHYQLNEDTGILERLPNKDTGEFDYVMDINKTGNCFIAHPEEGKPLDYWENAKIQNNEALINPLLGFDFNTVLGDAKLDNDLIDYVNDLSNQAYAALEACDNSEELANCINQIKQAVDPTVSYDIVIGQDEEGKDIYRTVTLSKYMNPEYNPITEEDEDGESPYTTYRSWLLEFGYMPAEKK